MRPVGRQTPSSGSGSVNGCAFGGGSRCTGTGGAVTTGAFGPFTFLPTASALGAAALGRPCSGRPPTGGGWFVYHQCSTRFTTPPPPWSLIHSTLRADHGSVPGAVNAWKYDQPTGIISTTMVSATARRTILRRRDRRARCSLRHARRTCFPDLLSGSQKPDWSGSFSIVMTSVALVVLSLPQCSASRAEARQPTRR